MLHSCQTCPWHWPPTGSRGAAPPGLACTLTLRSDSSGEMCTCMCVQSCQLYVIPGKNSALQCLMWQLGDIQKEKKHVIPCLFLFLSPPQILCGCDNVLPASSFPIIFSLVYVWKVFIFLLCEHILYWRFFVVILSFFYKPCSHNHNLIMSSDEQPKEDSSDDCWLL